MKACAVQAPPQIRSRLLHAKPPPLLQKSPISGTRTARFIPARASEDEKFNPVEVLKRESKLQSNRLPENLRSRVESAVEQLRYRVTVGDIAAKAGIKVSEAEEALKALAFDSLAALEVSTDGEIVYAFPSGFRNVIQRKSLVIRAAPVVKKIQDVGKYMIRVAFGSALVTSIAIVWFAITVILSSSRERDDRGSRGGGGFGGMRMAMGLSDMFYYFDPYYYRNRRGLQQQGQQQEGMSFLESIFSFVFGDGDPNEEFESARWKRVGKIIQAKGGVVSAEELAPYLDPPEGYGPTSDALYKDEGFVLPALITFGGEPFVDEEGHLLYRFPSLQTSGAPRDVVRPPSAEVPLEMPWKFTEASGGQLFLTVLLGIVNVVGVGILSNMLRDPQTVYVLAYQGLAWVGKLLPGLQIYAATFFAIPGLRYLANATRNAKINQRNDARVSAADELQRLSTTTLASKLASARKESKRTVLQGQDTVFSSNKDVTEQMGERELSDWDAQLKKKGTWL